MNFNFTSQICTTEEQSKRLLDLGLRKETADMAHIAFGGGGMMIRPYEWLPTTEVDMENFIPAWSLNRLIEILDVWCLELNFNEFNNVYEQVISYFEERVKGGFINKDYLEE